MAFRHPLLIPLLTTLCLLLVGCGTTGLRTKAAKPSSTPGSADDWAIMNGASAKTRLLQLAEREWEFFGRQTVVITADQESIPHVGIWEDEDDARSDRINGYWQAVGEPELTGRNCDQAWSAAFIIWLMRFAGVPENRFPSAISHRVYISQFLAETPNPLFVPHTLGEYLPKPADLICAIRENSVSLTPGQLPTPADLEQAKLHCDIVVEIDGRSLQAIGGNVRNSVSRTYLELSPQGQLQPTPRRPWFLILENRLK